jgi:hypothetical protein
VSDKKHIVLVKIAGSTDPEAMYPPLGLLSVSYALRRAGWTE